MKFRFSFKKWLICFIPALLAIGMYFLLPYFPWFTEHILVRGIFRVLIFPLEWLASIFPFSLTEILVLLLLPALIIMIICWVVRMIKSENRSKTAERGIRFAAFTLSLVMLVYMVTDGANYSRIPLGDLLNLPKRTYTKQELYLCSVDIAKKTSAAREQLPEDENGCAALTVTRSELLRLTDDCYQTLTSDYDFLITGTWRIKPVMLSHLWSYTGYTGVYCPWLLEASINIDVPVCEYGHTAAHEMAHTMGFAKEDECNFLGWLACAQSKQPDYTYSGHLQAYIYCSNALYKADRELWQDSTRYLSDGVKRDLKARNAYWKRFEGKVEEASQKFNDTFIKANGVKTGVFSYNEMVELILRYYDGQGLFKT